MIKAKDMAAQLRRHDFAGHNEEHVRKIAEWLDMQGDHFLGDDITLYLQKLEAEMYIDGEIKSVDYKYGPDDIDKVTTQDDLDDAKEKKEDQEDMEARARNPGDREPELDVVTNDGIEDVQGGYGDGKTEAVVMGDHPGAFQAGYTEAGMEAYYAERHDLLIKVRAAGNKAKQSDRDELTKILREWKAAGMSQREIAKRLKGTISQRTVGRILRGEWPAKRG